MLTLCSLNLNLFRQCLSFGITCDIQLHFFHYVMFRLQGTELSRLSSIISVLTSFMSLSCVRSLFESQEIVNVTSANLFPSTSNQIKPIMEPADSAKWHFMFASY